MRNLLILLLIGALSLLASNPAKPAAVLVTPQLVAEKPRPRLYHWWRHRQGRWYQFTYRAGQRRTTAGEKAL